MSHSFAAAVGSHASSPLAQLFEDARESASSEQDRDTISKLESAVMDKLRQETHHTGGEVFVSPVFFPSEDSFHHLINTLDNAKSSLDICVYSITDDHLAKAIIRAHERGVRVRIISDDEKADDLGSDAKRLAEHDQIPVRLDGSPSYMHHKYAVVDDELVMFGSYNWTKGARFHNREDLTLTNSHSAVQSFKREFEKLWHEFERHEVE
ncbi:hypothetical protein BGX21_003714 [Mortierella sp. AD011]|nr:hypothetical protein BGX20_004070 [Mortierella sp. AD010]KAF9400686.1 hypothetical protein BGX21_003714 [Mortierella sp. AD011]